MKNKFLFGILLLAFNLVYAQDDIIDKEKALIDSVAAINAANAANADAMDAYNQGIAAFEAKDYASAISNYNNAISMQPDFSDAYFNKGVAELESAKFNNAIASFDKVITLDPTNTKALNKKAETF